LPSHDAQVVFSAIRPNVITSDPNKASPFYYFSWLYGNLGTGFFLLALLGFLLMLVREGRRGLFAACAFWAPVSALSFLLAYRDHRFMFFAFPLYTAAFSYALVVLTLCVLRAGRSWKHALLAAAILLFGVRLSMSAVALLRDSLEVARGADTTLATRHPQYRKPCLYVRDHLDADTVVLADTYVTALYYIGQVDNWYPSRYLPWESWEVGQEGLKTLHDLQTYVAEHPKGYFLAEWFRFLHFDVLAEDRAWVSAHMKRIEEASSGDVILYAWGMEAKGER
jgi:hypothetical protein